MMDDGFNDGSRTTMADDGNTNKDNDEREDDYDIHMLPRGEWHGDVLWGYGEGSYDGPHTMGCVMLDRNIKITCYVPACWLFQK